MSGPPLRGRWSRLPDPKPSRAPLDFLFAFSVFGGLIVAGLLRNAVLFPAVPAAFVALCLASRVRLPLARPADVALMESPDDPDVCLVEVTIVRDGALVGVDRGVAWFEEDRLVYSGHRTSFALGGQDVLPRSGWWVFRGEGGNLLALPEDAVPLFLPSGHAYVRLRPLVRRGGVASRQAATFVHRRTEFRHRPLPTRGARQLPPLEPLP